MDLRIRALPQELQDAIFECLQDFPGIVTIDENYKPPAILQLNQKLRTTLVPKYYRETVFERKTVAYGDRNVLNGDDMLDKWARSLSASSHAVLSTVQITSPRVISLSGRTTSLDRYHRHEIAKIIRREMEWKMAGGRLSLVRLLVAWEPSQHGEVKETVEAGYLYLNDWYGQQVVVADLANGTVLLRYSQRS